MIISNEQQIHQRLNDWVKAIRERNWEGILAWHHSDIVMFDVPPPFQSVGIDAYRKTWENFLPGLEKGSHSFVPAGWHVNAGEDVAFCFAPMKCVYHDGEGQRIELDFRLTIGFRKIDGEWWFIHEHHSVPAE
jgi:ketosteroid isomerase-like protein